MDVIISCSMFNDLRNYTFNSDKYLEYIDCFVSSPTNIPIYLSDVLADGVQ